MKKGHKFDISSLSAILYINYSTQEGPTAAHRNSELMEKALLLPFTNGLETHIPNASALCSEKRNDHSELGGVFIEARMQGVLSC